MATENITTKYKIDISELKAGIQESNRLIKLANSEFKAAASAMDDWGNSTDGLEAKIKQLTNVETAEQKKLDLLKEQYKLVAKEQGENSEGAQVLAVKINNQQAAVNKVTKELGNYKTKLTAIETATDEAETAVSRYSNTADKLKSNLRDQEQELRRLKSAYTGIILEQGETSDEAVKLAGDINKLSSDLRKNKVDLANAENAANDFDKSLDDVGDSAGESADGFTVMKGAIAGLAAKGFEVAISKLKEFATELINGERALNQFQSATGVTDAAIGKYKKSLDELYSENYGEDMNDLVTAMTKVKQVAGDISPDGIKSLTKHAVILRDTFEYDFNESLRAAKALMTNFGVSGEDAMSMIAKGAQDGLDFSGELLDSISEYSVQFAKVGLSADDMFNIFKSGSKSSAWNLDKVGDAVKEFSIRSIDSSELTKNAFKDLGLNADEMMSTFAKGGTGARDAFDNVITSLVAVNDEVKRDEIGVALFGTQWEDLGIEAMTALSKANKGVYDTGKAINTIDTTKYQDLGYQARELGRSVKTDLLKPLAQELLPLLNDFVKSIIPKLKSGLNFIKENIESIKGILIGAASAWATYKTAVMAATAATKTHNLIMGLVGKTTAASTAGTIANSAATVAGTVATKGSTIATKLLSAAQKLMPWGAVVAGVVGVTVALFKLITTESETTKKLKEETEAIDEQITKQKELNTAKKDALKTATGESDYHSRLTSELKTLVDENGKVKEGYEDRVNFILTTLNEAYDLEMQLIDGKIQKYDEEMGKIDQVIAKQRAKAIVDAGQEAYTNAIQNEAKAWSNLGTMQEEYDAIQQRVATQKSILMQQGYTEQQATTAATKRLLTEEEQAFIDKYNTQKKEAEGYTQTISDQEYKIGLLSEGTAESLQKINDTVGQSYKVNGEIVKKEAEKALAAEQLRHDNLAALWKKTGDAKYKTQLDASTKTLEQIKADINAQTSTVEESAPRNQTAWERLATGGLLGLSSVTGKFNQVGTEQSNLVVQATNSKKGAASEAGKNLGIGTVSGFNSVDFYTPGSSAGRDAASGVSSKKTTNKTSGKTIGEYAIAGFAENDFNAAGGNAGEGVATGAAEKESTIGQVFRNLGSSALDWFERTLGINSPSRAFIKSTGFVILAITKTVSSGKKRVKKSMEGLASTMVKSFKPKFDNVMSDQVLPEIKNAKSAVSSVLNSNGLSVQGVGATSGNINYNFYQTNNSPKALSRLDIYRQSKNLLSAKGV